MAPIVSCDNLVRIYKTEETEVLALQGLDISIEQGELVAIIGASGSGKSTFLNILGGLDKPSAGNITVAGMDLSKLTDREMLIYKRNIVSFIWQNSARNLLPYLSALENIMLPMHLSSESKKKTKALELLELVGLSTKKHSRLNMLSGGEQQRIAIAIALANSPRLLLADEPTGSVDPRTANYIFDVFTELNKNGQTVFIVTHDVALSKKVKRVVAIRDGKVSSERILKEKYVDRVKEVAIDWRMEDTQEEYAIIDKVGRVQIPRELLGMMHLEGNKVRLEMQDGKVVISNPKEV